MKIRIITPAGRGTRYGNRVTARRWAGILQGLGHQTVIEQEYRRGKADLIIALHARRSASSIARFHRLHPNLPVIVALTGTDLYQDIKASKTAQNSLEIATRLITLQTLGKNMLAHHLHSKVRPIIQSKYRTPGSFRPNTRTFDVCIVGYLRPVKDPFRLAQAARLLPKGSRIRVLHVGGALSDSMERRAKEQEIRNPRYNWLRELPQWRTRRIIANSRALVITSRLEGGANVVSEALVDGVPVLASYIDGSVGLLGARYPGYFPTGDTRALAHLLTRIENEPAFLEQLRDWCEKLGNRFLPEIESESWKQILAELQT
jgi:putative glycosyltransferase (TIGR04348 family)